MEKRCFHPKNYSISFVTEVQMAFSVVDGAAQNPCCDSHKPKPHVKFECHECGFTAYYSPRKCPHWFQAKLEAAGAAFPQTNPAMVEQIINVA